MAVIKVLKKMTELWVRSIGTTNANLNSWRRRSSYSMSKAFRMSQTQTFKHKQKHTNNNEVRERLAESMADVTETKLYISNLNGKVSDDDIRELFLDFGELKRWCLHLDRKDQEKLDFDVKKLQSYVKDKTLSLSEKGGLSDVISPQVLRAMVSLKDSK